MDKEILIAEFFIYTVDFFKSRFSVITTRKHLKPAVINSNICILKYTFWGGGIGQDGNSREIGDFPGHWSSYPHRPRGPFILESSRSLLNPAIRTAQENEKAFKVGKWLLSSYQIPRVCTQQNASQISMCRGRHLGLLLKM